jgi:hypothetical protein
MSKKKRIAILELAIQDLLLKVEDIKLKYGATLSDLRKHEQILEGLCKAKLDDRRHKWTRETRS